MMVKLKLFFVHTIVIKNFHLIYFNYLNKYFQVFMNSNEILVHKDNNLI